MTASTGTPRVARVRRATRNRVLVSGMAVTVVVALLGASSSSPATADVTGMAPGSSLAQSAASSAGSGVTLTPKNASGVLGTLTAALTTNLVNAVTTLPNTVTASVVSGLTTTASLQARNGSNRQPRPTPVDNYPACDQNAWDDTNCYAVISSAPTLPPAALLAVSAGTVQGYATGDDKGYVAAAGSTHPLLLVPGFTIDLGVATSSAQCDTRPICTAAHSLTGSTITPTGGTAQSIALASGGSLARIGNTTIASGRTVPITNALSATANGSLLTLNVSLTLTQLLTALGTTLAALGAGLSGTLADNNSTVTLAITLGPGDISANSTSTASAWGVDVGINLVADIKLNVTGTGTLGTVLGSLLGSTELTTAGTGSPNLTDLKLAYSQANAGSLLPDFVPPALI